MITHRRAAGAAIVLVLTLVVTGRSQNSTYDVSPDSAAPGYGLVQPQAPSQDAPVQVAAASTMQPGEKRSFLSSIFGQRRPPAESAPETQQQSGNAQQAMVRYEERIPADEQPGKHAIVTVPAQNAPPGSVRSANRRINFPRDKADDVDVLKLQIFLDWHGYSPGEIDGQWGYNTERALYVYQNNNGMQPTGQLDKRISARLDSFKEGYLLDYTLTRKDLEGPFFTIPRDYYKMAELKYLPYESALEAIAEKFHCSQVLLRKLNPGVDMDNLRPGQPILALNVVDGVDERRGRVGMVRVSKNNKWAEAFDGEGNFMFYYPSTLGSQQHDPLPLGTYRVTSIGHNPEFKYQPKLFWEVDDSKPDALLPPGPNNPVGLVWIGTSRPNVGIHGCPNPENISKTNSHGCIRLTNWDALQLAKRVKEGTKLEFVQ